MIRFAKDKLAIPEFISVNLVQGTYQAKFHPIFNVVFTRQGAVWWFTFYIFTKGLQLRYVPNCKCPTCRRNRIRALFFLKPVDEDGNPLKKAG